MLKTLPFTDCSERDLSNELRDRGWTDGLPVFVPHKADVDRFVKQSGVDPDEAIGPVAPLGGFATAGLIAVNAYMAGCEPVHLPVVIAAIRALIQEPFNLYMAQVTTNPVAPLAIVNGPIRHDAQIRSGRDLLGPGPGGNGPIGRAVRLVMRNLGGSGENDCATHGSPLKYTLCIGEDEEGSPWEPLHVSEGYDREDSVVTTVGVEAIVDIVPSSGSVSADVLLAHLGQRMQIVGSNVLWSNANPVLLLTARHAEVLDAAGYNRRSLQEKLFEISRIPAAELPFDNPITSWTVIDDKILVVEKPEDIVIVIAGSPEGHHDIYMVGCTMCKATHASVDIPARTRAAE